MVKKTSAKTGSVSSAGGVDLHEVERILDFMRKLFTGLPGLVG